MRPYRATAGLALFVAVLVLPWVGNGSVAWAERKASVGQGGVADNRLAGGQSRSRLSDPVKKDVVGSSKKQPVGKSRILKKNKGLTTEQPIRRAGVAKPLRPQAMLTPNPAEPYHGMLQQPQRYTPRYEQGKGGVPNPNASALLHEHFQELDKNRDGSIDPFERALGRLDLDRDLADRQWQ
ncbi:EF-hand domain-containing protein [Nitrospira lenta]|nr:EF-hand domain-containing protein [Nitrospira lenta]